MEQFFSSEQQFFLCSSFSELTGKLLYVPYTWGTEQATCLAVGQRTACCLQEKVEAEDCSVNELLLHKQAQL